MERKITVHENVYNDFKNNKPKKQKFIHPLDTNGATLFQSFQVKEDIDKKVKQVDKRLKLAGLSTKILDEKYAGVHDYMLMIADLDGVTMWCNQTANDILSPGENPVLKTTRLEFFKLNQDNQHFRAMMDDMHESLPKLVELEEPFKTPAGLFWLKLRYERIDTLKGTPIMYMGMAKYWPCDEMMLHGKLRSKSDVVKQTFLDHGLVLDDVIKTHLISTVPVLCVNLIGRVLWMNKSFEDVFHKGENDLLEIFNPHYGFDAYEKGLDTVLKECPDQFVCKQIVFDRVNGSHGRAMSYIVTFNSLDMDLSNKTPREQADAALARIGYTTDSLDEIYDKEQEFICIFGLDGRLLYMNKYFREVGKKSDEHLMTMFVKYIKDHNENVVEIFDHILKKERPKKYIYQTEAFMKGPNLRKIFRFEDTRLDTQEGIPYAYLHVAHEV